MSKCENGSSTKLISKPCGVLIDIATDFMSFFAAARPWCDQRGAAPQAAEQPRHLLHCGSDQEEVVCQPARELWLGVLGKRTSGYQHDLWMVFHQGEGPSLARRDE